MYFFRSQLEFWRVVSKRDNQETDDGRRAILHETRENTYKQGDTNNHTYYHDGTNDSEYGAYVNGATLTTTTSTAIR